MWKKEAKSSFMVMFQTCIWGLAIANRKLAYIFQYLHRDPQIRFIFITSVLIVTSWITSIWEVPASNLSP